LSSNKAYILGAGPIGLVTAWKLAENGYDVEIFEKLDRVGGMCRSWKWNDFTLDLGPHIFHTPDKNLANFWETEFKDMFITGDFRCKNVKGNNFDEYYDYPLSWEGLSDFSNKVREKIVEEIESITTYQKANAQNYKEYIDAQIGPTLREMFFQRYPQKVWGIDVTKLTADWAPKRIQFRQKKSPFYVNEWVAVGKNGTGPIYEKIASNFEKLGGKIHLNTTVKDFSYEGNVLTQLNLTDRTIDLDTKDIVISSLPITLTSRFLGYSSPLQFRGIRIVYVAYNTERLLPKGSNWLYYDAEDVIFNRVTESSSMAPNVAPKGKTVLTAEITYGHDDEVDQMSDEEIEKLVIDHLDKVNLGPKKLAYASCNEKAPYVYPIQYSGFQSELTKTRAALNKFSQLYSLGTGGDFNYADSQILFHMAFDTVANICNKEGSYTDVIREIKPVTPNTKIDTKKVKIGAGYPAYIIAEAGLNHNGSIEIAKQLIDEAKKAGCSAVKFQTFLKGSRVSSKVKSANYAEVADGLQESISDMFDRLAMPFEQQKELFDYARSQNIEIFSTPFDNASVDFLEEMGVSIYKIASMDLVNLPLIKYVANTGKPMILSTGMSKLGQIEDALEVIAKQGNPNVAILHCNSSYPATEDEMNLKAIQTLAKTFNIPTGLSDHTFGLFVSHTALVLGAQIIERHFTLSRSMEGPDHILSSEPSEMAELVDISKRIPVILGNGVKRIQPNEYITLNSQRKSIYAKDTINEGELITEDMLTVKGPGGGLLPKYLDIVIGRKAQVTIEGDHPVSWKDI